MQRSYKVHIKAVAVLKVDNKKLGRISSHIETSGLRISAHFITRDQMGCIALKIATKIFVKDLLVSLGRLRVILSRRNERRLLGFCNPTSIRPRREAGWAKQQVFTVFKDLTYLRRPLKDKRLAAA